MGGQPVSSGVIVFVVTALVVPLLLAEFGDWCPWVATRIVRWAAGRLGDPASCQRYEEEWVANLNEVPGRLTRLLAAFSYLACMPVMRRSIRSRLALPPASPVTRALPPLPAAFFAGRAQEISLVLEHLRAAAADGKRSPVFVTGEPGVGKTAIANICARQLENDFPDGQLFLPAWSLRSADDCLDELLTALGVPVAQIPPGQAGKSALFRDRVAGRRVLVVLDDIKLDQVPDVLRDQPPCPV